MSDSPACMSFASSPAFSPDVLASTTAGPPATPLASSPDEAIVDRAPRESKVMIVDDEEINVDVVQAYLEEEGFFNFITTTDARQAIPLASQHMPDIVLLDINMPHVNGLQVLRSMRLDADLKGIPTVILTAETGSENKLMALRLGATDFLAKPVDSSELMLRMENVLAAKVYRDYLQDYSRQLELQVRERTAELEKSRQEALHCLARAAEYRDDVTGRHVFRVGRYSALIALQLGYTEEEANLLESAALLHDLGKIGIPDAILNKKGPLTEDEYAQIKNHCEIGVNIIAPPLEPGKTLTNAGGLFSTGPTTSPVLKLASKIALTHHEKFDGGGYPNGLRGEEIPLEGRIVAVADVFDALGSKRSYKETFTHEKCFAILEEGRGQHFDPKVLDAFFAIREKILSAWSALKDPE
ncbi:MAG: HD domain-containing phosphohydrolase [Planctomycetota bacterium]